MYSMNLAASLFQKSKLKSGMVRVLQVLNIVFQVLIVILLIVSFFMSRAAKKYDSDSYVLKKSVFEQRKNYNIDETLKFWQEDYFKLSVIQKQIEKSSAYAIAMKELGNYLPEDDLVHAVAIENSVMEFLLKVNKQHLVKKIEGKEVPVDYANVLKKRFANSVCFDKEDIKVEYASQQIEQKTVTAQSEKSEKNNKSKEITLFDNEIKDLPKNPNIKVLKVTMKLGKRKANEQ